MEHTPSVELLSMRLLGIPNSAIPVSVSVPVSVHLDEIPSPDNSNKGESNAKDICIIVAEVVKASKQQISTEIGENQFVVLQVRNGSRLMAAISTNQQVAQDVLYQHIVRSRQHHTTHLLSPPTNAEIKYLEFSELLDPESTRNMIIPLAVWEAQKSSKPQRLYWALYDPFSSSTAFSSLSRQNASSQLNSTGFSSKCGVDYNGFKGTIRSGFVVGSETDSLLDPITAASHLSSSVFPNSNKPLNPTTFPHSDILPNIAQGEVLSKNINDIYDRNNVPIKSILILLLGNEPIMSSTHPVSQSNILQTWQYYTLQTQIFSQPLILKESTATTALPSLPLTLPQSIFDADKTQLFEIIVSVISERDKNIENIKQLNKCAIINGKIRFTVSNPYSSQNEIKSKASEAIMTEKLEICFPTAGMFSVHILCHPIGIISDEDSGTQQHFSISSLTVEVHE